MRFAIKMLLVIVFAATPVFSEEIPTDAAPVLTASKTGSQVASFEGTGSQASTPFSLKIGPATFRAELKWEKIDTTLSSGEGKFSITLLNSKGETVDVIFGTFDHFDGARTIEIAEAGQYAVSITAPGEWNLTIDQ